MDFHIEACGKPMEFNGRFDDHDWSNIVALLCSN